MCCENCTILFNKVVDNYIKKNALKGKGKLGLRAKLLVGVSGNKKKILVLSVQTQTVLLQQLL